MGFWDEPTVGVIVGGVIASATQFGTQMWGNWRDGKRQSRAADEKAKAERDALQIRTLADLQEQLEAVSVMIGGESARPVKATMFRNMFTGDQADLPDLTSFSRALMLCSRLDDRELAETARTWLKDVRVAFSEGALNSETMFALRDRRLAFQDQLGEKLLSYYA